MKKLLQKAGEIALIVVLGLLFGYVLAEGLTDEDPFLEATYPIQYQDNR